jgi:hypothetical protein
MSEVSETIVSLEQQKADAKVVMDRRNMALRLAKNTDFRTLILDGFCLHDAARYVQTSADPAMTAEARADALSMAQASGHLKRYLSLAVQMGAHAERTMPELDEALVEARSVEDEA